MDHTYTALSNPSKFSDADETVKSALNLIDQILLTSESKDTTNLKNSDNDLIPARLKIIFKKLFSPNEKKNSPIAIQLKRPLNEIVKNLPQIVIGYQSNNNKSLYTRVFKSLHQLRKWITTGHHPPTPPYQELSQIISQISQQITSTFALLKTPAIYNDFGPYSELAIKQASTLTSYESKITTSMEVDCVKAKILSTLKRSGYSISPTFLHQIQSDFLTNKLKSKDYLNTPIVLHDWTGLNIKICMRKQNIGLKNFIKLPSIKIDPHYYRSTHPAPLLGWFIPDIRLISTKSDPSLQIQHVPKIQQKKQIKKILENLEATRAQILIRKYDYAQYHYKNLQSLFETHQNFIPEVLDTFCSKLSQHGDPLTFNTQTTYQIQIFLFKIFWAKAYSEFHRTPIKPSNKDSIDKFVSDLLDTHIQTYLSNTIASLPHYLKDYIKMTISLCKPIVYSMASDNLSSLFIDNYNTNKNTLSASFQDYFYKQQSLMNSNLNALTHSMLTLNSI